MFFLAFRKCKYLKLKFKKIIENLLVKEALLILQDWIQVKMPNLKHTEIQVRVLSGTMVRHMFQVCLPCYKWNLFVLVILLFGSQNEILKSTLFGSQIYNFHSAIIASCLWVTDKWDDKCKWYFWNKYPQIISMKGLVNRLVHSPLAVLVDNLSRIQCLVERFLLAFLMENNTSR
jgi:hypothetical protein